MDKGMGANYITMLEIITARQKITAKRAIRLSKNLIALYFYNNSNIIAVLLPLRAAKW